MKMTNQPAPAIAAIATHLPEGVLDNDEIIRRFAFDEAFLQEKLGITRRHIAAETESVSDMAVAAAETLLARSGIDRNTIGLLVLCTQNPDYRLPTTANLVQTRLNLPTGIAAFDISQGCSGYVYGLSIVHSLMVAHRLKAGLLITSEAYSKVIDPNDRTTVPLFGDGASATLFTLDGTGTVGAFSFGSDGSGAQDLIVRAGGSRDPRGTVAGDGALHMNGRAIFNFMMRRIPADVKSCLALNQLGMADIDYFLFHQASRYMVQALARALDLPDAKVPISLAETGNTVSSSLPMLIDSLGGVSALSGKRVLLSGFGVGLSWASTVLNFGKQD
jgi:3-oxoacyl-[acyl-carrier-protein] synthase III